MRWLLLFLLLVPFASGYAGYADGDFSLTTSDSMVAVSVTDGAVYRTGYYSFDGGPWQPFNFSGAHTNGWITGGSVTKSLSIPAVDSSENYVIIYSCTKSGSSWDCHGGQWQIVQFSTSATQNPTATVEIFYQNDFEQHDLGSYTSDEYLQDWQAIPFIQSVDNTPMFPHASIVSDDGSHVFRNDFSEGSLWCNDGGCFRANHYMGEGWDELYLSYRLKVTGDWSASKGKLPSLNAYLTDTPGGAGQCVTGVDDFSGRMMFFGSSYSIGLHFYPYHMGNWEGDFYRDAFYSVRGYYPSDCLEVLEFVCSRWYCFDGVWNEDNYISSLEKFRNLYGRDPTSAYDFFTGLNADVLEAFESQYGRSPSSCTEFTVYANTKRDRVLCGVYSGSGREVEDLTLSAGKWYTFTERVVVNDVGEKNGFVEVFVDGVFVDRLEGLEFRATDDLKINNIGFDGFFGGGESDSPKHDVSMFIDDVVVYRYTAASGEPVGQEKSAAGRVLPGFELGGCVAEGKSITCAADCGWQENNCGEQVYRGVCASPSNDQCVSYDGMCNEDCGAALDHDCLDDFPLAEPFVLKSADDYGSIVYIDPSASVSGDGSSPQSPRRSFAGMDWQADTAYLLRRGTTDRVSEQLLIDQPDVFIGSYGVGQRPVLQGNYGGHFIQGEGARTLFRDVHFQNPTEGGYIMYLRGSARGTAIYNCTVSNAGYDENAVQSWTDQLRVLYSDFDNVSVDALWIGNVDFTEVAYNRMRRANQIWYPGLSPDIARGDLIQLSYGVRNFWIHHNDLDRSDTANKFCFHTANEGGYQSLKGIIEYNTMIGPIDSNFGGAQIYIDGLPEGIIRHNLLQAPAPSVIYMIRSDSLLVYNNTFVGFTLDDISGPVTQYDNRFI